MSNIRTRSIVIALVGVVLLSLFVQWSDIVVGGTMVAGPFPPLAAVLFWCVLLAGESLIARLWHRGAFLRPSERLVILATWLIANTVAGRGFLHPMLTSIAGAVYYARTPTITNAVRSHIPDWLALVDANAAKGFFEGGQTVPWHLWASPLLTWAFFAIPFLVANVSLCALFERVWVRHERLSFPLVALPIELMGMGPGGSVAAQTLWTTLRTPLLLGLAFPLVLHGFGIAHAYYPIVPAISLSNDISGANTVYPLSVLNPLYVNLYPILIGFTLLAPADVTLGVWFFVLLNKGEMFLTAISGWNEGQVTSAAKSVPPFVEEQSAGAYLALGGLLLWHARTHLNRVWEAMGGGRKTTEDGEYRVLGWAFVFGAVGVLLWSVGVGFPLWYAMLFFGFYGIVALVLSRLMAEGGVAWILAPILPDKLLFSLFGSTSVATSVLTRTFFLMQHLRDTRQMLAPAVIEVGKVRDVSGFGRLRFYGLLLVAVLLALVVGVWAALPQFYAHGATALVANNDGMAMTAVVIPRSGLQQAEARLQTPIVPSPAAGVAVVIGGIVAYGLSLLRLRYGWWPLHPLGYALTGTLQLGYANKMLLSVFIGWLLKATVQRYGGMRGFHVLRAVAFGLILGDLLMGSVTKCLDALLGPSEYALF